jgi:hypothetical protein
MKWILVGLPIAVLLAWIWFEQREHLRIRWVLVGLMAVIALPMAFYWSTAANMSANSYFTAANHRLLEASVKALDAGRDEQVLAAWTQALANFDAGYETRGRYAQIIDDAVTSMAK